MVAFLKTLLLAAGILTAGAVYAAQPGEGRDIKVEEANRALVIHFYDQFFNHHKVAEAARVIADNYRQHNPGVPNGKAPLVNFLPTISGKTRSQKHASSEVRPMAIWSGCMFTPPTVNTIVARPLRIFFA
ncbi:hypothetical protein BN1183_AB_00160 [Pantoea ananatis]|nr:hypothetical protein BN1183_AB_00160 [Pantoea ananatis]